MQYSIISCKEQNGSRTEQRTLGQGFTSSVQLQCDWADVIALADDILLNRRPDPLRPNLYANSVSISQAGGPNGGYTTNGQVIIPNHGLVTVQYVTLEFDPDDPDDPNNPNNTEVVSETLEPTMEMMTVDNMKFQWGPNFLGYNDPEHPQYLKKDDLDRVKEDEAPGRLMPGVRLQRNWRRVAVLPQAILSAIGHCNNNDYYSWRLGLLFAKETLLYQPPVLTRTIRRLDYDAWDVAMSFLYKPWGWNRFWRAEKQQYNRMYIIPENPEAGAEPRQYDHVPLADLTPLIGG